MFTREELQDIVIRAEELAGTPGVNPRWIRALLRFADAANTLDAYYARGELAVEEAVADAKIIVFPDKAGQDNEQNSEDAADSRTSGETGSQPE